MAKERRRSSAVTVGNWMWTLLLSNLTPVIISALLGFAAYKTGKMEFLYDTAIAPFLFYIITAIATRRASKRSWAIANIIWMLIVVALVVCAVVFFGNQILTALITLTTTPVTQIMG